MLTMMFCYIAFYKHYTRALDVVNISVDKLPWNAKYETVYRWLASFIVIYTIMNLKS